MVEFDLKDFGDTDNIHDLLIEREELLRDKVRERYKRLETIESALKDAIDDAGEIVDEELGLKVNYEHRRGSAKFDPVQLYKVVKAQHHDLIVTQVVYGETKKALGDVGYTDREIESAVDRGKPVRGPLVDTIMPRSIRDV